MSELVERRWTRYGKDRVYVKTPDGVDVGYVDLQGGTVVVTTPGFDDALAVCLQRWSAASGGAGTETVELGPALETSAPWTVSAVKDLAQNRAGSAARARYAEVRSAGSLPDRLARVFAGSTEARAWLVGARGEEKVARQLARLGARWRVLHSVPVGTHGCDIDHVVIGPAGVITIDTKRRPRARTWVGEQTILVNGQRTDYLRNSRHEARRAARLLSVACQRPVAVTPAIVFVDLHEFTVKRMPSDVYVTTRRRLIRWLRRLPETTSQDVVEMIYRAARRSSAWQ